RSISGKMEPSLLYLAQYLCVPIVGLSFGMRKSHFIPAWIWTVLSIIVLPEGFPYLLYLLTAYFSWSEFSILAQERALGSVIELFLIFAVSGIAFFSLRRTLAQRRFILAAT